MDPVAFSIGPLSFGWYGLMYLFGFAGGGYLGYLQARRDNNSWNAQMVQDFIFYVALGVIIGGRLGYVVFYNLDYFLSNPLQILQIWNGGMSFHGGFLGVCVAVILFSRQFSMPILQVGDFVATATTPGLAFGRLGNFINSELWGKVTDSSWGMWMQDVQLGLIKRYPSQLYEMVLEGIVLGIICWFVYKRFSLRAGMTIGAFMIGYGVFRSIVEFFRVPDAHLGYLAFDWLTMGQILSLPMILIGIGFCVWASSNTAIDMKVIRKESKRHLRRYT